MPTELNAIVPSAAATNSTASATSSIGALQSLVATLEAELNALITAKSSPTASASNQTSLTFTRVLSLGSKGADVSSLQQILRSSGLYTYPTITGYFGTLTQAALAAYQTAHGLEAVGYTGPLTRALLNGVAGDATSGSAAQSANTSSSGPPPTATATTSQQIAPLSSPPVSLTFGGGGEGGGGGGGSGGSSPTVRSTPPVISAISSGALTSTGATITWTTDEAASSQISYGATTSYGSSSSSAAFVTSHSITLTGLTASTTYDFQVSSADAQGNLATSSNQTFTTAAYNYYVDSVNGNDANPGTSPSLAFQNITALPTITASTSIGLADGSYWRQQFTIAANNVTVTGYGSGALPILDASDIIPNASFTKTSGYTNVYNTGTITFADGGDASGWVNLFETGGPTDIAKGSYMNLAATEAAVDTTPCSYYVPGMTTGAGIPASAIIYIHACDGVAHGSIAFSANPSNGDTITLNGVTWTFTTAAPGTTSTQIRENLTATLDALVTQLDASSNASLTSAHYGDTLIPGSLNVVYLTDGAGGNAYTLAASVETPSGGTLTGGQTASSPITNGYAYEYSNRRAGLLASGIGTKAYNFETRKAAYVGVYFQSDGGADYASGLLVRDGGRHSMLAPCGSTVVNSTFIDDYYSSNGGNFLVFFDNVGSNLPTVDNNNVFQQSQWLAGNLLSSSIQHTNSGSCGSATHNNNWIIAKNGSNLSGISDANVTSISASGNILSQGSQLISIGIAGLTTTLSNNQIVSSYFVNAPVFINAANTVLNLTSNKFCVAQIQNGVIYSTQNGTTLNETGNLFYTNTIAHSFAIDNQIGGTVALTANSNDFGSAFTAQYYYNLTAASGSTFAGDNNIYELVATNHWVLNNVGTTTLATWKAAVSPNDANATTTGGTASSACTLPTIPSVN